MKDVYIIFLAILIVFTACSRQKDCVMQIGSQVLKLDTVMQAYRKSSVVHEKTPETEASARDYCLTRYSREMYYLAEADKQGIAEEDSIREKVDRFMKTHLTRRQGPLYNHVVQVVEKATPEHLHDIYEKRQKEYKLAHILLASQSLADSVLAEIQKGADFAEMAEKLSFDDRWDQDGGEWRDWYLYGSIGGEFDEQIVNADMNKPFGPIQTEYGYHILKIVDTRPRRDYPFQKITIWLQNIYNGINTKTAYFDYQQTLPGKYGFTINPEAAQWIVKAYEENLGGRQAVNASKLTQDELKTALATFHGGSLAVEEFIDYYNAQRNLLLPPLSRSDYVEYMARRAAMLDLMYLDAISLKLDELPEVQQNVFIYRKNLIVSAVRKQLSQPFEISEEEIRAFCEADSILHKQDYSDAARWARRAIATKKQNEEYDRQIAELKQKYPVKFCNPGLARLVQQMNAAKAAAAEIETTNKR